MNDTDYDGRQEIFPSERQAQVQVDSTDPGHDGLLEYRLERSRGPVNPSAMTIFQQFPAFALDRRTREAERDESTLQDEELYQRSLDDSRSIFDDHDARRLEDISLRRERESDWRDRVERAREQRWQGASGPGVSDADPSRPTSGSQGADDEDATNRELNWPLTLERQPRSTKIPDPLRDGDVSRAQSAVPPARQRSLQEELNGDPNNGEKERSGDKDPKGDKWTRWLQASAGVDALPVIQRATAIASTAKPIENNDYLPNLEIIA